MRSPSSRLVALTAAVGLSVSCSLVYDLDELAGETGATSGGGDASTASSAGGSGVGGSGAGGSGGMGAGPPPEPCKGGAGVCLAPIPAGWSGYFSDYTTSFGGGDSMCPDGSTPERAFADPSTTPAECSPCDCGTLTIACDARFQAHTDIACLGVPIEMKLEGECVASGASVNGIETDEIELEAADCPPSGGVAGPLSPQWTTEHTLCNADELQGGGCPDGDACIAKANVPICIKTDGDVVACPDGWGAAAKILSYADGIDGRGCSDCSCAPPPGNLCAGGTYQFFDTVDCSGAPSTTVQSSPACVDTSTSNSATYVPPPLTGTPCAPDGGEATGSVVPGQPVTICCR